MASKWNFKHTFVLAAIAAFLVVSVGEALATPVLVHQSRESYSPGGTNVTGCTGADGVNPGEGCGGLINFQFGIPTGASQWEVVEKVYKDITAGTTEFRYTLFNDQPGLTNPSPPIVGSGIASFNVQIPSGLTYTMDAPASWTLLGVSPTTTPGPPPFWHWETSITTATIQPGGSLGCDIPNAAPLATLCFRVVVNGLVPIGFNTTKVDVNAAAHTAVSANCIGTTNCWQVSAPLAPAVVPEPASLMLLGSGLAGLGLWRRRHSRRWHA